MVIHGAWTPLGGCGGVLKHTHIHTESHNIISEKFRSHVQRMSREEAQRQKYV